MMMMINLLQRQNMDMRAASRRSVLYRCSREQRARTDIARDNCTEPASTGSRPRAGECSAMNHEYVLAV